MESIDFPFISLLSLLACSGFFSACETSLLSISRLQLNQLRVSFPKRFERIQYLLNKPTALVATIMIGNEVANVIMASIMTSFYDKHFDNWAQVTIVNLCTVLPLIVIFGEITPRVFALRANLKTANFVLPVVWLAYRITLPIRTVIESLVNIVLRMLPIDRKGAEAFKEEDFLLMLEDSKSRGAIQAKEQELIENVFELDDETAKDLMRPLDSVTTVHKEEKVSTIVPIIKSTYMPRIPVMGSSPKHVVGILHIKDVIGHAHREIMDIKAKHLMKDPLVVDPDLNIEVLFKRMRQFRNHLAIVAPDENAKQAIGVVTMEDVLNQVFGELWQ